MKKYLFAIILVMVMLISTSIAFADTDPNVIVVNPEQYGTIYSDSLLVSVKILEPKIIKVAFSINVNKTDNKTDLAELDNLTSELVYDKETFTSTSKLSFYTKRVENIT